MISIGRMVPPVFALLLIATPAFGAVCTVPGTHATIQQAVADPSCATISLAGSTYHETLVIERSVTLQGVTGATVLTGRLVVRGSTTQVQLTDLAVVTGCDGAALEATDGARIVSSGLAVVQSATASCPGSIFSNGFESGNTSAWSVTVP